MIIDAHVHPFTAEKDNTALLRYGGPETPEQFIEEMKRAGISMACGSVIHATDGLNFGELRRMNDDAVELNKRFPDFFIPGIHIQPMHPEESCRELERMNEAGVKFVGELVPYMMGYERYAIREAFPVYDLM